MLQEKKTMAHQYTRGLAAFTASITVCPKFENFFIGKLMHHNE
jgi:hypothetical protein